MPLNANKPPAADPASYEVDAELEAALAARRALDAKPEPKTKEPKSAVAKAAAVVKAALAPAAKAEPEAFKLPEPIFRNLAAPIAKEIASLKPKVADLERQVAQASLAVVTNGSTEAQLHLANVRSDFDKARENLATLEAALSAARIQDAKDARRAQASL